MISWYRHNLFTRFLHQSLFNHPDRHCEDFISSWFGCVDDDSRSRHHVNISDLKKNSLWVINIKCFRLWQTASRWEVNTFSTLSFPHSCCCLFSDLAGAPACFTGHFRAASASCEGLGAQLAVLLVVFWSRAGIELGGGIRRGQMALAAGQKAAMSRRWYDFLRCRFKSVSGNRKVSRLEENDPKMIIAFGQNAKSLSSCWL